MAQAGEVQEPTLAESVAVGYESSCAGRLPEALDEAAMGGFTFLVVPLAHPGYVRPAEARHEPWTRSDKLLGHAQYSTVIVGRISRWAIDAVAVPDTCTALRTAAECALTAELEWAAHIGVYACLVDAPLGGVSVALAAVLRRSRAHVWLRFRWAAWRTWQDYCSLLEHSATVAPVLQLCGAKDDELHVAAQVQRWLAEPLKAVFLPSQAFVISQQSGNPVLPKVIGSFIASTHASGIQLVLQGRGIPSRPIGVYRNFVALLIQKRTHEMHLHGDSNAAYNDVLQAPLQPLADQLESGTYEVFETDPVKYQLYEDAIAHLLPRYKAEARIVVLVAGAGRGPLVNATLRAAQRTSLLECVHIYAIEKNPNAVQTLRNMACEVAWQEAGVRVIASDMREWRAPEQAHLLVSELLGSFGDNELSPECLDGAVQHLRATGVSVPCSYSSYLAAVCAPKIWGDLHAQGDATRLETPYVVKLQQVFHCCGAPQVCFTFTHAPLDPSIHSTSKNRRYTQLRFVCGSEAAMVHGFAGYFECTLAEGAALMSTAPHSASPGMFSWFPLFLPLRVPVALKPGQHITVHVWRCVAPRKVWYEWALSEPLVSALHNPNGRSYNIGL